MTGRHAVDDAGGPAGGHDALEGPEWWATLAPDALEDETRTNRRRERWLLLAAVVALAITAVVLVVHPGPLLP